MVSFEEVQAAYYMVAATGVFVAAVFYILNLRISQKTLRINTTNSLLQSYASEEGQRRWIELMNMKWSDYDDFEKKYGSDYNPDNYAKRASVFYLFDIIGNLLRKGFVDRETVYDTTRVASVWAWVKFKPVIDEQRRRYMGKDTYSGFEYLAGEMMKMKLDRDPSYKIPETFSEYIPGK